MVERIFDHTKHIISEKIERIQAELNVNSQSLAEMGDDGDAMDDELMYKLHAERELLVRDLRDARRYLNYNIHKTPDTSNTISIGHSVRLSISYPDGESEELNVTLGSTIDIRFLVTSDNNFDTTDILISDESALGTALLGCGINDQISFETLDGRASAVIQGITLSELIT